MKVLGVDIDSRKFGATLIDRKDNSVSSFFFRSNKKETDDRIEELYNCFETILKSYAPDKVYIEEPIYIQNFKTTKAISETVGNCKSICRLNKIEFETVPNKTWKKEIIGNGNCSKDDIKKFMIDVGLLEDDHEQDMYDSCGIALYGLKKEKNG
jgi:Holliday junction resolvasome RuvABC endonuclease subunit